MIRRRTFIQVSTLGLLRPLGASAQQAPRATSPAQKGQKAQRLGLLMQTTPAAASHITAAFIQALRELGHVEGRDVVFEYRWAEGKPERLPSLAADLLDLKVDLIVASSIAAAEAARKATATIPIVMVNAADPVEAGLVRSLVQPGGNVTGLSGQLTSAIRGKQLQLLREAVPGLARVAVLRRAALADSTVWKEYEGAARTLDLKIQFFDARGVDDLERAFAAIAQDRAGALLVPGDPVWFAQRARIVALATQHRLPGIYSTREFTEAGGLMSYSARLTDQFRRAATYVDKILRGANPATLPIEQPTQFELVVNQKTATALRLVIPQTVLIRADEVIR